MSCSGSWRVLVFLVVVPFVLSPIVLHLAALYALDSPGRVCASCHFTRKAVATWKMSSHRSVSCASCHAPAKGLLARESAILGLLADCVSARVSGGRLDTHVDSGACLHCHNAFYEVKRFSGCRFVEHPHHSCLDCHRGLVHGVYDRDALALSIKQAGRSLHVDADFPKRLREAFSDKDHFQHGFRSTMAFCGRCHRMAPRTGRSAVDGASGAGVPVCETCHIRY